MYLIPAILNCIFFLSAAIGQLALLLFVSICFISSLKENQVKKLSHIGNQTRVLLHAVQALYQLSYSNFGDSCTEN